MADRAAWRRVEDLRVYAFIGLLSGFAVCLVPRISNRIIFLDQCALVGYVGFLDFQLEKLPLWAYVLRGRFGSTAEDFLPFHLSTFLGFAAVIGPLLFSLGNKNVGEMLL